jgi:GNAT superfamily N-acetyltransferase
LEPVNIRLARQSDTFDIAGVHVRSWQVGYRGLLPEDYLAGLRPEDRASRYRFYDPDPTWPATLVAVESGCIVGFATIGPCADPDPERVGELMALYVDPPSWGTGTGRALMATARGVLAAQGCTQAVLWVLAGNNRAERFYRRDGWIHAGVRRQAEVWGIDMVELRYERALH